MKKFLVVVDMQNDFIDGALGTSEAAMTVGNAVEEIKHFEGEIFATYDTHNDDYLSTQEGENLPVVHCIKGTEGWKLNPEIQAALDLRGYTSVEKNTFGSLDLPNEIAKAAGKEDFEIELIGLCTDICVVSNALILKAFFPDKKIKIKTNCCAGVTKEKHNATLETLNSCQIEML